MVTISTMDAHKIGHYKCCVNGSVRLPYILEHNTLFYSHFEFDGPCLNSQQYKGHNAENFPSRKPLSSSNKNT